jgi:hypothetical protein
MRYLFLSFLFSITVACTGQSQGSADINKLDWLVGTWSRTNVKKAGRTAYEVWQKTSETKLSGYGVVLQGADTVFLEKFELVAKDDGLYYVADVPENKEPVPFKVTSVTVNSFVCENPEHDFPKKISYQWDGTILIAQISGNGKTSDFLFQRK